MPLLESNSIDVFFADPPFNLQKNYGAQVNDGLGDAEYIEWCYRWIDEGIRLLKPGGAFYLYRDC